MKLIDSIVLSDIHLSDAEPDHELRPLWKKFKRKEFFIDQDFSNFLEKIQSESPNHIELILNGDIFDFDSVMKIPENPTFRLDPYELRFGLNSLEDKSIFKIDTILSEHSIFTEALSSFIRNGHSVIFVIGNHDIELNWIGVQNKIKEKLKIDSNHHKNIRFCEFFYISNKDTLVEHGHQYDPYCMSQDPINPVVKKHGEFRMRLPFGNLANRFMVNVMGFKNPHNDDTYVKTFKEFLEFFWKYEIRNQPLIVFDWLRGAIKTLIYSVGESFLPRVRDPLTYNIKLRKIAKKANSDVSTVLSLRENHAHPAVRKPISVIRELWLDRAFLLFGLILLAWQLFSMIAVFVSISINWFFVPLVIFLSFFGYYANGVGSEIRVNQKLAEDSSILSAKLCKVQRIVLGHTHSVYYNKKLFKNKLYEVLNPGTWSIYFKDIECTEKHSLFTFVWIKHNDHGVPRDSKMYVYDEKEYAIKIYEPLYKED